MKEYKVMAHINSLNGEKAEITVLEKVGDNDYIVDYKILQTIFEEIFNKGSNLEKVLNIPINAVIKNVADVSNLSKLPVGGAVILILISMILTMIAGLIPAKMASKKDPVEALRSE